MNGFLPYGTTSALGSFSVQSDGYIQGNAMADPAIRTTLSGGTFLAGTDSSTNITYPIYGGMAITEYVSGDNPLGPNVIRSLNAALITGFSVFDQATSFVNNPSSPVPTGTTGQTVSFYRLGSGARIPVYADASLVSLVNSSAIDTAVYWDVYAQKLVPASASSIVYITAVSATFASNVYTVSITTGAAVTNISAAGDSVTLIGLTNTGTGGNAALTGTFTLSSFTSTTSFQIQIPGPSGYLATLGGNGVAGPAGVTQRSGQVAVKVLDIQVGNCKVVNYNGATGQATWNNNGTCALIKI